MVVSLRQLTYPKMSKKKTGHTSQKTSLSRLANLIKEKAKGKSIRSFIDAINNSRDTPIPVDSVYKINKGTDSQFSFVVELLAGMKCDHSDLMYLVYGDRNLAPESGNGFLSGSDIMGSISQVENISRLVKVHLLRQFVVQSCESVATANGTTLDQEIERFISSAPRNARSCVENLMKKEWELIDSHSLTTGVSMTMMQYSGDYVSPSELEEVIDTCPNDSGETNHANNPVGVI